MRDEAWEDGALFEVEREAPRALSELYVEPPFTVLDRRSSRWQERRRQWMSLGIQSELGRTGDLSYDWGGQYLRDAGKQDGTSVFDPVLTELAVRWWSGPDDRVLDPFAGGSVRGLVAGGLGRRYTGIDLRREQVEANRLQVSSWQRHVPQWIAGDAGEWCRRLLDEGHRYDLVFTCPPYGDLEVYSDDPSDLSAMAWEQFLDAYRAIIRDAVEALHDDRFFAIVVGDVRDKRSTAYRGLPMHTQQAMLDAGLRLYTEAVILDPVGAVRMTAGRYFTAGRKLGRTHQQLLVGVKGNWKRAARRLEQERAKAIEDEAALITDGAVGA